MHIMVNTGNYINVKLAKRLEIIYHNGLTTFQFTNYQINVLHTLNLPNVVCQIYFN